MFYHLTSALRREIETVQSVLEANNRLRSFLVAQVAPPILNVSDSASTIGSPTSGQGLGDPSFVAPNKLDWQVYDHCAALTRLYAAYEQFTGALVAEYVKLLPSLYPIYADLPSGVKNTHRVGVGHILTKMGRRGRYKHLLEGEMVRDLAVGLAGSSPYTLLVDAFFVDLSNLRFEILCRLFSSLGLDRPSRYISRHRAVTGFIKQEKADSSSADVELQFFIDYRNEAAHKKVDNLLAIEAIGSMGRFLLALGDALADMVADTIAGRRLELNQYTLFMSVSETFSKGSVVVGIPVAGLRIQVGDEVLILSGDGARQTASVEEIQLNDISSKEALGDGTKEVGLLLSVKSSRNAEIRILQILPAEVFQASLPPEGAPPSAEIETDADDAYIDLGDQGTSDEGDESEGDGGDMQ